MELEFSFDMKKAPKDDNVYVAYKLNGQKLVDIANWQPSFAYGPITPGWVSMIGQNVLDDVYAWAPFVMPSAP